MSYEGTATLMNPVDQIAGYQVLAVLGYGANSTIYAVQDPKDEHVYALKRVVKRTANDQRFIDQAVNEHEVSSRLDHAALRHSYRMIRRRKVLRLSEVLILMELVDGVTLEQHRPPRLRDVVRVFIEVASGLEAMHKAHFVHSDIKPNNVLLAENDGVKLIDFGQSCRAGTVKNRIQGTPDYIAPEQVKCGPITAQTDVFNLGATIYWCVTNQYVPTMIPRSDKEVGLKADAELKKPRDLNPSVPTSFERLMLHCLETSPDKRPASMNEVKSRLEIVLHQLERGRNGDSSGEE